MENALQVVEVQGVHGYIDDNGSAWLNAEDVARGLGFTRTEVKRGKEYASILWHRVNKYLGEFDFRTDVCEKDFLPENIFYLLAMKANNAAAKKFQLKIANEILPSIRKTGVYMTTAAAEKILLNPDFIIQLAQQVKDAQAKIALLQPKADFCDNVLLSDEHLTSELIAKEYGHSSIWLNQILIRYDIIYKRGRRIYLKAKYANLGYRISETVILEGGKTVVNHFWTQKGRHFIYNFLKSKGIVPLRERSEIISDLF